jgi:poly(3-hydroxybutyrate) depolymerase
MNGQLLERTVEGHWGLNYYVYVPTAGGTQAKLFITVHGISRNAKEHAELLAPWAEQYGVVLVSPLFSAEEYPDYICMGREGLGLRSDHALEAVVAEVGNMTGASTESLYLFGYSGGGQFAHRFMMAYPERVERLVVGAAGWYTFPDGGLPYPQGIIPDGSLPGVVMEPERFLSVPVSVIVGASDTERTSSLNQEPAIDAQQGTNRVERGRTWLEAMRGSALACGLNTEYRFGTLPGVGHSFAQCMGRGQMGRQIFRFLFEPGAGKTEDVVV